MRCKDSVEVFNIVVNLEGSDAADSTAVVDPNGILSFWDFAINVESNLESYGFIGYSTEYHEYDPSMLTILKACKKDNSNCKVEMRFRVSESTEKLLSTESSQRCWKSQFEDDLLPGEYFIGSCEDYVDINTKRFNNCGPAMDYLMDQLETL